MIRDIKEWFDFNIKIPHKVFFDTVRKVFELRVRLFFFLVVYILKRIVFFYHTSYIKNLNDSYDKFFSGFDYEHAKIFRNFQQVFLKRKWYCFIFVSEYRRERIYYLKKSLTFDVALNWVIEESWWVFASVFVRWFFNFYPFRYNQYKNIWIFLKEHWFMKAHLKETEKILGKSDGTLSGFFSSIFDTRKKTFNEAAGAFFFLKSFGAFDIFSEEDDYEDEWLDRAETNVKVPLAMYHAQLAFFMNVLPFCYKDFTEIPFSKKDAEKEEWKWYSIIVSDKEIYYIQKAWYFLEKYVLYYIPGLYPLFFYVIPFCASGLPLVKDGLLEALEDYYFYPFRDELYYVKQGLFYIWIKFLLIFFGVTSFSEIFTWRYFFQTFLVRISLQLFHLLWFDFTQSLFFFAVAVDLVFKEFYQKHGIKRKPPSLLNYWVNSILEPVGKAKKVFWRDFGCFFVLPFKDALHFYFINQYLKGFLQLLESDKLLVDKKNFALLSKIQRIENKESEEGFNFEEYRTTNSMLDFIYYGLSDTFHRFIDFICDPIELKYYREKKQKGNKNTVKVSRITNPWQFFRNLRASFFSWCFSQEFDFSVAMGEEDDTKNLRNKRQYLDYFYIVMSSCYTFFYDFYVHKTKLEFWLRPFWEGLRLFLYIFLAPFYYIWFFASRFLWPLLLLLKELWFSLGLKITSPFYKFFADKAVRAIKEGKPASVCKFWTYWAPDLLDCFRGSCKAFIMFCITGVVLDFAVPAGTFFDVHVKPFIENQGYIFDTWVNFLSICIIIVMTFFCIFCRDYRETVYEELDFMCAYWFGLIYTGMLLYFIYLPLPTDLPTNTLHHRLKGHDMLGGHQVLQCLLPHYRRSYIPPFN